MAEKKDPSTVSDTIATGPTQPQLNRIQFPGGTAAVVDPTLQDLPVDPEAETFDGSRLVDPEGVTFDGYIKINGTTGIPLETDPANQDTIPAVVTGVTTVVRAETAAISGLVSFAPENRQRLIAKLGLTTFDRPHKIERPQKRQVCYLLIDSETVDNSENQKILRNEINLISGSEDFYVTEDSEGNLIIIALSEREGLEKLVAIQQSIESQIANAKMLLELSTLERRREATNFNIHNYPDTAATAAWKSTNKTATSSNTTISRKLFDAKENPSTRIGKNITFKTAPGNHPDYLYLLHSYAKVSEERGGPDRRIGYEHQFRSLQAYCGDIESDVIILEGPAWQGKSRLRTELCETLDSFILCSGNAGDANDLGSSMVSLLAQLEHILPQAVTDATDVTDTDSSTDTISAAITAPASTTIEELSVKFTSLTSFQTLNDQTQARLTHENPEAVSKLCAEYARLPRPEQMALTLGQPQLVKKLCLAALLTINRHKNPHTILIMEDLHHIDRLSLPFLLEITDEYLDLTEGKFLPIRRHEKMYQSMAFNDFLARRRAKSGDKSVKTVSLEHGLNFTRDPQLAYDFAWYSLPIDLRERKKLTDWPAAIARIAGNSPGYFKSTMDAAQEKDPSGNYRNLITDSENISLTPEFLAELAKINPRNPSDLTTFFYEIISRLPEIQRTILEAAALLNERMGPIVIIQLAQQLGGLDSLPPEQQYERITQLTEPLIQCGYLKEKCEANEIGYDFDHENMRELIVAAMPEDRKLRIATILNGIIAESSIVSPESKHLIATILTAGETDENFWNRYQILSEALIVQAGQQHDSEYLYNIADRILNSAKIQRGCTAMENRMERIPEAMERLIAKALTTKADAARFLGKFEEVEALVATLKRIHRSCPGLINILEVHLIDFERAYMESKTVEMEKIAREIESCGVGPFIVAKAMLEIKVAYKNNDFETVGELYRQHERELETLNAAYKRECGHPLPAFLETKRVAKVRCPFEAIRVGAEQRDGVIKFDSDVVRQPVSLNSRQKEKMTAVSSELRSLEVERRLHPLCFDHYGEFALLDERAEITAFSGEIDEAIKLYGECWLLATQMKVHNRAARAARIKGDLVLQKALTETDSDVKINLIEKAIGIYSKEGIESSDKAGDKNLYKFLIRGQRIRAIATLAHHNPVSREKLEINFAIAMGDFEVLNRDFTDYCTDAEVAYCVLGAMGHIIESARELDIALPENLFDARVYPYLNFAMLEPAQHFGNNMTDFGFGEVERKMEGLEKLRKIADLQRHEDLKRARSEAGESPNYQLLARLHRFQATGELAKSWAKLPNDKHPDKTRAGIHFETAIVDYKFLTSRDFLSEFPDQARSFAASFHDICEAAATLNLNLYRYFTRAPSEDLIRADSLEREIDSIVNLSNLTKEDLYNAEKAKRQQRDTRLVANQ